MKKISLQCIDDLWASSKLRQIWQVPRRASESAILAFFFVLTCSQVHAGVFEVSLSGSAKRSQVDEQNYTASQSATGSISYYFAANSAIELSFTNGKTESRVQPQGAALGYTIQGTFGLVGLDLVLSFGSKQSFFQPYIKLGGAHLFEKKYLFQLDGDIAQEIPGDTGLVPSAGIGFKVLLTRTWSVKIGVSAWSGILKEEPIAIDYAGTAGLSWLF